mgnify:CR=1 FL=1
MPSEEPAVKTTDDAGREAYLREMEKAVEIWDGYKWIPARHWNGLPGRWV